MVNIILDPHQKVIIIWVLHGNFMKIILCILT